MQVRTRPCDCEARIAWRGGPRIPSRLTPFQGWWDAQTTALGFYLKRLGLDRWSEPTPSSLLHCLGKELARRRGTTLQPTQHDTRGVLGFGVRFHASLITE